MLYMKLYILYTKQINELNCVSYVLSCPTCLVLYLLLCVTCLVSYAPPCIMFYSLLFFLDHVLSCLKSLVLHTCSRALHTSCLTCSCTSLATHSIYSCVSCTSWVSNVNLFVFVICIEATIYFWFHYLHDCTFKLQRLEMEENIVREVTACDDNLIETK